MFADELFLGKLTYRLDCVNLIRLFSIRIFSIGAELE